MNNEIGATQMPWISSTHDLTDPHKVNKEKWLIGFIDEELEEKIIGTVDEEWVAELLCEIYGVRCN